MPINVKSIGGEKKREKRDTLFDISTRKHTAYAKAVRKKCVQPSNNCYQPS